MTLELRNASARSIRNLLVFANGERFLGLDLHSLQARLDHAQNQWARFSENNAALIEETDDADEIELHRTMYNDVEQEYLDATARVNGRIQAMQPQGHFELPIEENNLGNNEQDADEDQEGDDIPAGQPNQNEQIEEQLRNEQRINGNNQVHIQNQQQVVQPPVQIQPIYVTCGSKQLENTWGYFDGNLSQWQGFHDRFKTAVHTAQ